MNGPVSCFHDGADQVFIDPVVCIDCRLCVDVCQVNAIFADEDVPEKWMSFIDKNRSATADYTLPEAMTKAKWDESKK